MFIYDVWVAKFADHPVAAQQSIYHTELDVSLLRQDSGRWKYEERKGVD